MNLIPTYKPVRDAGSMVAYVFNEQVYRANRIHTIRISLTPPLLQTKIITGDFVRTKELVLFLPKD